MADATALDREGTVVLVYDGVPDASGSTAGPSLNIRDYITAYDWAVHFFLDGLAGDAVPDVRLFILDVTSRQPDVSFPAQQFPGLLSLMPWLRAYRLFELSDLQERSGNFGVGFMRMVAELMGEGVPTLRASRETDDSTIDPAEELARSTWVNNLTKPEGRHAVSNLVAPLVLADGLGRKAEIVGHDSRRAALAQLLWTLGVLERKTTSGAWKSSPLNDPMVEDDIFGQFDRVRFLLVDDQAALGYHDVLASLLFGDERSRKGKHESVSAGEDERFSLRSLTGPAVLVESLFETTGLSDGKQIVDWPQPRVLDTLAASSNEESEEGRAFDVLLLDLRLFGDSATVGDPETRFWNRLLDFYEQSNADQIDDPHLGRAEKAARARIGRDASTSGDSSDLMRLALLPLLLSYVDPSLPIVLFSSTRQQAVVESLARRPGIITSFQKPVVSGYTEEQSPHDYVTSLSDALTDALRLHEVRCIWKRLVNVEWVHQPIFEANGRERGRLVVYNIEGSPPPKRRGGKTTPRESAGEKKPYFGEEELTTRALRPVLARHYIRYIAGAQYFDFTIIPWELLNGTLVPLRILERPWLTRTGFNLPEDLDARNYVARAIGSLRNKKAHGYAHLPENEQEKEEHRLAAIIIFLLFLDFIEGISSTSGAGNAVREMRNHLKFHYEHIDRQRKTLKPHQLEVDTTVAWLEVVVFTACFAAEKATDSNKGEVFLSSETGRAIHRTVDYLTAKSPTPHPDPAATAGSGERVVGVVEFYSMDQGFGFIRNPVTPSGEDDLFLPKGEKKKCASAGQELPDGTLVEFVVEDRGGRLRAKDVRQLA
jgi:cold shock CspA family protein